MQALSSFSGFLVLFCFFVVMLAATCFLVKRDDSKDGFLVAGRNIGLWPAAFSIAATWIWAPALFIAAQKAYLEGWVGLFWFLVPNVACLIIFSEFAMRFRERLPRGYSISEYMLQRYSPRVQKVYHIELLGLAVCSFVVQLLAGGLIFSTLTGISFLTVTVVLSLIALSYAILSGIKASVLTDHLQMIIIFGVSAVLVPWVVFQSGGVSTVIDGLAGYTGEYTSLFSGKGGSVFFTFGIAVTIGLLAGPFGDQTFWQRSQSVSKKHVRKAFIYGALIFALVPLSLSLLGFVAAGAGVESTNPQLINLQAILHFLPAWTAIPFAFMLLSGLVSTLDSALCAVTSIVWGDIIEKYKFKNPVMVTRLVMAATAVAAVMIANIPGMQILYLFLFYGTLRASVLVPTIMTLISYRISERGMFYGITTAIAVGLPVFAYGNFNGITPIAIAGSLLTVSMSGAIAWVMTVAERKK